LFIIESNIIHLTINFDQIIENIIPLTSYEIDELYADTFVLCIHGKDGVKLLDSINKKFINEIVIPTHHDLSIKSCSLWSSVPSIQRGGNVGGGNGDFDDESTVNSNKTGMTGILSASASVNVNGDSDMRQVNGIFVGEGLTCYLLESDSQLRCVYNGTGAETSGNGSVGNDNGNSSFASASASKNSTIGNEHRSNVMDERRKNPLDDIVLGCGSLSEILPPWVPLWGLHRAVMLRLNNNTGLGLGLGGAGAGTGGDFNKMILNIQEMEITNDKCRFVTCTVLKVVPNIRANRAVLVLSDGTVTVIHL
jgi:hypothetical protein